MAGIFSVDLPMDIVNLSHDFKNWEWSCSHAGKTFLDAVGVLPGIGVVKNVDEVGILLKGVDKAGDVAKHADEVVEGVGDVAKHGDEIILKGTKYSTEYTKKLQDT